MNKVTSEKRCMYDLMVELGLVNKCASGIYMLMPRGMEIYLEFQKMFQQIVRKKLKTSIIDVPLMLPVSHCSTEVMEHYEELCFATNNKKGKKYILTSDISLFSQQLIPMLDQNSLLCMNVRFRNNFEGSDSKKDFFNIIRLN